MGGLGPGIGGLEYLVIAAVALIVVGPERLPGMLRQLGKWVSKMRGMANDFRASFDEMARQSELDDLRKEVEALRNGQGAVGQGMVRLGAEADAAFKDIKSELDKPALPAPPPPLALDKPEFPEPAMMLLAAADATAAPPSVAKPTASKAVAKPRAKAASTGTTAKKAAPTRKTPGPAKAGATPARKPRKAKTES